MEKVNLLLEQSRKLFGNISQKIEIEQVTACINCLFVVIIKNFETRYLEFKIFTAAIVQLVRTPDCGSGGRGFEPH